MRFLKKGGAYLFIKNENGKEIFLLLGSFAYNMCNYKWVLIFSQVIFQVAIFNSNKYDNTFGSANLFTVGY